MKIEIEHEGSCLGATGGTGRLIVRDALAKGHSVVAPVRSKARALDLPGSRPKLPIQQRCGLGSVVMRLTGEAKPTLANMRNDLAHGYPFDGLPSSGLLEVVRDLINYANRDMIAEHAASTQ